MKDSVSLHHKLAVISFALVAFQGCETTPAPPPPPPNPISVSWPQGSRIPCNGIVDVKFKATHTEGAWIEIASIYVHSTRTNSHCAQYDLQPDRDSRREVIDQIVRVGCRDCARTETILVGITVRDRVGNSKHAQVEVIPE